MKAKTFRELRDQLADPLLTALTIMLAILLFVIAPLQAGGIVAAHNFGIVFGLVLVAAVFIVSASWIAVVAILLAVALIVVATVFRLRQPSIIDIYLESSAWLITSLTLAVVVGRAVFARGKINYHRVIGGVLLYLNIGMFFVALYVFAALLVHNAFTGLGPLEDNLTVGASMAGPIAISTSARLCLLRQISSPLPTSSVSIPTRSNRFLRPGDLVVLMRN